MPVLDGRFALGEIAGEGGMGEVYRARDLATGTACAVKLLATDSRKGVERFLREAEVLTQLRHPHVVRIFAHGVTSDGRRYIAMEWLEGVSLEERLRRGALPVPEVLVLGRLAAEALGRAHALGIVHRDVKPSNLYLVGGAVGGVKVLDFGVARLAGASRLTEAGHVVGTPFYMAPEQARAAHQADARSDVFSLGCVLFHALTGRRTFVAPDITALLCKVLFEEAPRASSLCAVPEALDGLLARMLARDPAARPRDGLEAAALLGAVSLRTGAGVPSERAGLGDAEQRVVTVLAAVGRLRGGASRSALRQVAGAHGGRFERLADGTLVTVFATRESAARLGARAARAALQMRSLLENARMVLATGLAVVHEGVPLGNAIERALGLLGGAPVGAVCLDHATAGLLDAHFALARDGVGIRLTGERAAVALTSSFVSPFVGRAAELAELEAELGRVCDGGRARALFVGGEAGRGKSRLGFELLGRPRRRALEVWIARGDPALQRSPFGVIGAMLRRQAGVTGRQTLAEQRRHVAARLGRAGLAGDADCLRFVTELARIRVPDADDEALGAARADPALMWQRVERAFSTLAAAACGATPAAAPTGASAALCVLADGLEAFDEPSLRLLGALGARLADRPLLLLGLGRPEAAARVARSWPGCRAVTLGPLTESEAGALVAEMLGEGTRPEVVRSIVKRAAGNAYFLEELVRAHREGRGQGLPEGVLGMVQARLDALGPASRRVLRAASVFGRSFRRDALDALLPPEERGAELGQRLAELEAAGLVASSAEGDPDGDLEFTQAVVHEAAHASLTDEDRRLGHRLAAGYLLGTTAPDEALLARHFELGGEPTTAAEWYLRAAHQALRTDDEAGAAAHAERGLGCAEGGRQRGSLLALAARARFRRGELGPCLELAHQAVAALPPASAFWFHAASLAVRADAELGHSERVASWTALLRDAQPGDGAALVAQLEALCWVAPLELGAGRTESADDVLRRAALLAERCGELDAPHRARLEHARAVRALYAGNYAYGVRAFSAGAESHARAGHRYRVAAATGCLGLALCELGRHADAVRALEAALPAADELGGGQLGASLRVTLATAQAGLGALDGARRSAVEALGVAERLGHRMLEVGARLTLAGVLGAAGLGSQARIQAASAVAASPPFPGLHARALGVLARAEFGLGHGAQAAATAGRGLALLRIGTDMVEGEASLRLVHVDALLANGARDAAVAALADARARLLGRAERIDDPSLRRSFLEASADHARTLHLARELGAAPCGGGG
ncbi:MAG: protein kinase [Myxococcales bacterium]|nr:protein kinase [Myxococcales bacterium]